MCRAPRRGHCQAQGISDPWERKQSKESKARTSGCQTSPRSDEKAQRDSPIFRTDLGALQQWRTIQASRQIELQRLQDRTHHHPGYEERWASGSGGTSQQVTFSPCRLQSPPLINVWTPWCAAQRPQRAFHHRFTVPTATLPIVREHRSGSHRFRRDAPNIDLRHVLQLHRATERRKKVRAGTSPL